jgi:GrpB-like predicted nucleotidyltransferase (UPF0157 family)
MANDHSLHRAISEEVRLEPHDARWAGQFASERDRLLKLLPGHFTAIEHIGSTAVPRLAAKPIIDLIAGVGSIGEADALLDSLCSNGYVTSGDFNATLSDRRWLMRHAAGRRTHHLHLVVFGSDIWLRWLRFRDLLRASPEIAADYGNLKRELAVQHHHDREAYTRAKSAFIDVVLGKLA